MHLPSYLSKILPSNYAGVLLHHDDRKEAKSHLARIIGLIIASILLIVEAVIALGVLLSIPTALGYGALSALQRGTAGVKSLQEYHAQAAVEAPARPVAQCRAQLVLHGLGRVDRQQGDRVAARRIAHAFQAGVEISRVGVT